MINGIDVSSYQSETYDTTGLAFVIVKRTEGQGYVNPKAPAQVAHGRANGLLVGHYCYPHIRDGAQADADYFLAHLGSDLHAGDLIVLDWEWYGQAGVSAAEADAYKDQWLARVKGKLPGHRVGTYSDVSNWTHVDQNSNAGDFLWIATGGRPAGQPGIKHSWTIHQYSTAGGIDHDVAAFADKAAMLAWANPAAPKPPAPKPTPAPKPKVSLAHIVYAARHDPAAAQGHTSYKADVLLLERALHAEGLLAAQYVDGSFGTKTKAGYAEWQRRTVPGPYDGIPGKTSLSKLGDKHGFQVGA